jgi:hypothetical protein
LEILLKSYFGGKFELEKSLMVNAKCCALFRTSSASIAAKVYSRSVLLSFRIIISRIIIIIQPEQVMLLFDTAPPPPSARVSSGNLTVCASCVCLAFYIGRAIRASRVLSCYTYNIVVHAA